MARHLMIRLGRFSTQIIQIALVLGCTWLAAPDSSPAGDADDPAPVSPARPPRFGAAVPSITPGAPTGKPIERLREGTRLSEVAGSFVAVGADSITFSPSDSKDSYRVLENLSLQRISQQLDANRGQRQWIVSGTITEFRGANFLLVTKAVIQLQEGDTASGQ